MNVTLSPLAGAGWQFFDNNGIPLAGGLLYTYSAGTTTPLATYTTVSGSVANSNPIVLDSSGRLSNELWLTVGYGYKFVLKDANANLIGTYDNIPSNAPSPFANDANSISYEQGYTPTAGAFIVGQSYQIASIGTTNFVSIGAASNTVGINFTATGVGSGTGTAKLSRSVQNRLQDSVSVLDFGADPTGTVDSSAAFTAAVTASGVVFVPVGNYLINSPIALDSSPLYATMIIGATESHIGGYDCVTKINLINNTQYFAAIGYDCTIKNIGFVAGVDVFHHTSSGIDVNTTKLVDVFATQWTGAFFKGYSSGNGSHLSWVRPVLINTNVSCSVFDGTAQSGTGNEAFDILSIQDGWIQVASNSAFKKPKIGPIDISDTRFVPFTNASSIWFDLDYPITLRCDNTDFGGESSRQLCQVGLGAEGMTVNFTNSSWFTAGKIAWNCVGAPASLSFINCGTSPDPFNVITIDPTMSAASLKKMAQCLIQVTPGQGNVDTTLISTNTNVTLAACTERIKTSTRIEYVNAANMIVTGGYPWMGITLAANTTYTTASPDVFGTDLWSVKYVLTNPAIGGSSVTYMGSGTPGLTLLAAGNYTLEMLVTVTTGNVSISVGTTLATIQTFVLSQGTHQLCIPFQWTQAVAGIENGTYTVGIYPNTDVTISRWRICKSQYQQRDRNYYASAVPSSSAQAWLPGDRVVNSVPTVGQPKSWICTVGGTPGTWVSEGNL